MHNPYINEVPTPHAPSVWNLIECCDVVSGLQPQKGQKTALLMSHPMSRRISNLPLLFTIELDIYVVFDPGQQNTIRRHRVVCPPCCNSTKHHRALQLELELESYLLQPTKHQRSLQLQLRLRQASSWLNSTPRNPSGV
jgi:hypothetical protein